MNPSRLLAEALELARECQYQVREEYLEGAGGGHCAFSGKKWLLLDITQSAQQQLDDVLDALRCEPKLRQTTISAPLAEMLGGAKRAA